MSFVEGNARALQPAQEAPPPYEHAGGEGELRPTDLLHVPHIKRLRWTYDVFTDRKHILRLNYGVKEITFDDERFFAFGERIAAAGAFTGAQAMTWGPGYSWDELEPMLVALIDNGILALGERTTDPRGSGIVPALTAPSRCPFARAWSAAECEALSRELTGRAVEAGYLETFVMSWRVAHPSLDGEDRQVGESNAFPSPWRLERKTEWRVCQYPGSRFRDETPMNITALRAMIKHWKPMLSVIHRVRAELGARLGLGQAGWTIGDLHVLGAVVCSLPAYEVMREWGAPRLPIHPVLSSMFRVTDGVRMAMHELLFDMERPRDPATVMTGRDLHDHVERNASLMASSHGVCAGPPHLIDEYLASVVDGQGVELYASVSQEPAVQALLAELPAAIDYGLLGMRAWSLVMSLLVVQGEAYERLLAVLSRVDETDAAAALRARLAADYAAVSRMQVALAPDRETHLIAYVDAYDKTRRALRAPLGPARHSDVLTPVAEGEQHRHAAKVLAEALRQRCSTSALASDGGLDQIVRIYLDLVRREQAIFAEVEANQGAVSSLLGRARPTRPFGIRDHLVAYKMEGNSYPDLTEALEEVLSLRVRCTASSLELEPRHSEAS